MTFLESVDDFVYKQERGGGWSVEGPLDVFVSTQSVYCIDSTIVGAAQSPSGGYTGMRNRQCEMGGR